MSRLPALAIMRGLVAASLVQGWKVCGATSAAPSPLAGEGPRSGDEGYGPIRNPSSALSGTFSRKGKRARSCFLILSLLYASPVSAAITKAQLDTVQAAPPSNVTIPLNLGLIDLHGTTQSLGTLTQNRPSLLMLADTRCTQLCGSILAIAANALQASGLRPNQDFNLLVVGFNPDATAPDSEAMRTADLGPYPDLAGSARFLTGSTDTIDRLERAVGFTAVRDTAAGRYAHPADLFVLTADGRVSRLLNGLSLDPDTVRLALVEAGQGRIGSLIDRLHVLCYGLDPLSGASTALAQTMLRTGATLTLVLIGGGVILAVRRRGAPQPGEET